MRFFVAFMVTFFFLFLPTANTEYSDLSNRGDINGDGVVNQQDLTRLTGIVETMPKLTTKLKVISDINLDGRVNIFDVMALDSRLQQESSREIASE